MKTHLKLEAHHNSCSRFPEFCMQNLSSSPCIALWLYNSSSKVTIYELYPNKGSASQIARLHSSRF